MKHIVLAFICLALLLPALGAHGAGEYEYAVQGDGTAVLTRYLGQAAELEIPAMLDGHPLVAIGEGAFRDCVSLVKVILPEGVVRLAPLAFYNCSKLAETQLPATLLEIGELAFAYCSALRGVAIPEGTQTIGEYAFGDCAALAAAIVPAGVSQIGTDAFFGAAAGFMLYVSPGSFAQAWAEQANIPFAPPEQAPSLQALRPEPTALPGLEAPEADLKAGPSPDPESLSGLWLVMNTYESWHGEDGVEQPWDHSWSIPALLDLYADGQGVWTEIYPWGTLVGVVSYDRGDIHISLDANGPVLYEGQVGLDVVELVLQGTLTEEAYTEEHLWAKGTWSALMVADAWELSQYRELKPGVKGEDVAALKVRLFDLGYFRTNPGTSNFTETTGKAVAAFEEANGMPSDGVADPVMQALFYSDFAMPKP